MRDDDRLKGMVTDRDIVIRCVAEGGDPAATTAGSLADGKPVTIGADDPVEEVLSTMSRHQVRRLPVIDGHRLVGSSPRPTSPNTPRIRVSRTQFKPSPIAPAGFTESPPGSETSNLGKVGVVRGPGTGGTRRS